MVHQPCRDAGHMVRAAAQRRSPPEADSYGRLAVTGRMVFLGKRGYLECFIFEKDKIRGGGTTSRPKRAEKMRFSRDSTVCMVSVSH